MAKHKTGMVFFVGAGPGDPELITVKGKKLLAEADVVLYTGSLVSAKILEYACEGVQFHSSAGMKLEQQVKLIKEAVQQRKQVIRLHTGDPSIYSAISEQMRALEELGIPYRVVPGVSSAFAAAAALGIELTIPGLTQTLILTRLSGRTPVPEEEALAKLAAHGSSLVIFLSSGMIGRVVQELITAEYPVDTPVAVAYRVTWPEERIIHGTLGDIERKMQQEEITHHALIVVSPALDVSTSREAKRSHLYGDGQSREGRDQQIAIVTLTRNSVAVGRSLLAKMDQGLLFAPKRFLEDTDQGKHIQPTYTSIRQTLQSAFQKHQALVAVMSSGIVVREIAPLLRSKHVDPAVVVIDEAGRYIFSLLSGHKGGANQLAEKCAEILGGQAVITTASDIQGLPALDLLSEQHGWIMGSTEYLTTLSSALVNGELIHVFQDSGFPGWLPDPLPGNISRCKTFKGTLSNETLYAVCVTYRDIADDLRDAGKKALVMHPPSLHLGIGCNRDTPAAEIESAVRQVFKTYQLSANSLAAVASIDLKADEQGLLDFCKKWGLELITFTAEELSAFGGDLPNPSKYALENVGAPGVAEPAAALSAGSEVWLVEKQIFENVTVAVALKGEK